MGAMPVWWTALWGVVLLTCLGLWVLASRRGRSSQVQPGADCAPTRAPAVTRPPAVTRWTPQPQVMGPVSGWPHCLEAPDAPPAGSPEDRPDLWAMLS